MKKIVMLGTSPDTRGGIAAVIGVYRQAGLFDRWPIIYLPTHRDGSLWRKMLTAISAWFRFLALLVSGNVGLVYVHSASGPSFWRKSLFMLPALLARRPVVFHLHGGGFIRFYTQRCGSLRQAVVRWVLLRAYRIVVLSSSWHQWMKDTLGRDDVVVIANPVCMPNAERQETSPPTILFLGRLEREKGIDDLIRAFAQQKQAHPEVQLICAGDGNTSEVLDLASELGVATSVQLPGWVGAAEKERLLASAAIFVLPSHIEAMPMSLLEAMAWGVPVVATRVGSIPDVVTDGTDGILVAPRSVQELSSSIATLLANATARDLLGKAGQERVRREFGDQIVMDKMAALFRLAGITELAQV